MKKTLLAALIGSAVLLTGCQDKDAQAKIEQLNQTVAQLTAENAQLKNAPLALFPIKEVLINKDETLTNAKEKTSEDSSDSARHLTYKITTLKTDIEWLDTLLRDITLESVEDFDTLKKEILNDGYSDVERLTKLDFVGQKERLATFSRYQYSYDGGAHGMYLQNYFNIDLRDHHVLTLQDIFQNNPTLLQDMLWENYLNTTNNQPFIEKKDMQVSNNFYFDLDGVHFVYQPYEIGPFAEGVMEVVLWWGELNEKKLLKQDFIKKYNLLPDDHL